MKKWLTIIGIVVVCLILCLSLVGCTPQTERKGDKGDIGAQGIQGIQGATGNGILGVVYNLNDTLTITFTNGTSYTTPSIKGLKGDTGDAGKGIASVSYNGSSGKLTITFTDSSMFMTGDLRGDDGANGLNGATGATGRGIASALYSSSNGTITITFTDNSTPFVTGDLRANCLIEIADLQDQINDILDDITDLYGDLSDIETYVVSLEYRVWLLEEYPLLTTRLENKDSGTWQIINDNRVGILQYSPVGDLFTFDFKGYNLEPSTDYCLIYYADPYAGNNPGFCVAVGTTDIWGYLHVNGLVEIGHNLPVAPDANIITDYADAPDYYANNHGAKIWLVPADCYDQIIYSITSWQPDRFLFETDLIWYVNL